MTKSMKRFIFYASLLSCSAILFTACGAAAETSGNAAASKQEATEAQTEQKSGEQMVAVPKPAVEESEGQDQAEKKPEEQIEVSDDNADVLTEKLALDAVRNYYNTVNPGYEDDNEYGAYWDVSTDEPGEIVVLYRSYTSAINRYYVNAGSGDTYVTEQVPGIIDDEQKTGETFNAKDYLK